MSKVCWIFFSNTLAIVLSFGLLIPWAMVRITKYRLSCISIDTETDLDTFIAGETERASAVGEEAGDFLDIDLGL